MIPDFFLNGAYWFLSTIIGFFPASQGFPAGVSSALVTMGGYVGILDPIVPIATLSAVLLMVFSVEIGVFGFRSVKWVLSHLPFIGGRG